VARKLSRLTMGQCPGIVRDVIVVLNWPTAVGYVRSGFKIAPNEGDATASPNCRGATETSLTLHFGGRMPAIRRELTFVQTLRQFVRPPTSGFEEYDGSRC